MFFFTTKMFKLSENCEVDRRILKFDYLPREDSVISLLNSYLDLKFDVVHAAINNRYVDKNDIRSNNLEPIALFSNYNLTASSRKHLQDVNHAHIVSLMYKLKISARVSDDSSTGFSRDRGRIQRELSNKKNKRKIPHQKLF